MKIEDIKICPICKIDKILTQSSRGDRILIRCPRCKDYECSYTLLRFSDTNPELKFHSGYISGYIRRVFEKDKKPSFISTDILREMVISNPIVLKKDLIGKYNGALDYIYDNISAYTDKLTVNYKGDANIAYTLDLIEFADILEMLAERDKIIISSKTLDGCDISLPSSYFLKEDHEDLTYLVEPEKPLANKRAFFKVLNKCIGDVILFDKYLSIGTLNLISEFFETITSKRIKTLELLGAISPQENPERFRKNFKRLKSELSSLNIECNMKIVTDKKILSEYHDRWIKADNITINSPSRDTILKGQYSEFKPTTSNIPFNKLLKSSHDILDEWNKIQVEKTT